MWKERNNRIFRGTAHSIENCMVIIHSDISAWTDILSEEEKPNDFSYKGDVDDDPLPANGNSQMLEADAQV